MWTLRILQAPLHFAFPDFASLKRNSAPRVRVILLVPEVPPQRCSDDEFSPPGPGLRRAAVAQESRFHLCRRAHIGPRHRSQPHRLSHPLWSPAPPSALPPSGATGAHQSTLLRQPPCSRLRRNEGPLHAPRQPHP